MFEDLRSAVRQLWRSPGFVLAAALSLALGTGANSALFSFVDGMFLRPMGVPDPDNVARVFATTEQESKGNLTWPEFEALRSEVRSFRGVAALQRRGAVWAHGDEKTDVMINGVSSDFFQVLGVEPAVGRMFGSGDTKEPVVVIGHHAWQKWFSSDAAVIGKTMRLSRGNPVNVTIVGVLPETFRDVNAMGDRDVWAPPATFLAMQPGSDDFVERRNNIFEVFARLAPGRTLKHAQAEVEGVADRLRAAYPESNSRRRFEAILDFDYRMARVGGLGVLVLLVVSVVMAIAAVNVANLFLARVEERRRELSVRAAMGASPWRLARQMLAESVLTGLAGLALGVVVGSVIVRGLPAMVGLPAVVQHWARFQIDGRVFLATSAVALLTALLFGLFPAIAASKTELNPGLKSGSGHGGSGRMKLRHWLAVSQITICVVLLTCSALLVRSFWNAQAGDVGLSRNPVLAAWTGSPSKPVGREEVDKIRALPGVRQVALAFRAPLSGSGRGLSLQVTLPGNRFFLENPAPRPIRYNDVTPEFFELMGVRLLRGRLFSDADRAGSERVMVISEGMANRFWPGEDPIGRIVQSGSRTYRVIGMVANAPFNSLTRTEDPYVYTCFWQRNRNGEFTWLVGTTGAAGRLLRRSGPR